MIQFITIIEKGNDKYTIFLTICCCGQERCEFGEFWCQNQGLQPHMLLWTRNTWNFLSKSMPSTLYLTFQFDYLESSFPPYPLLLLERTASFLFAQPIFFIWGLIWPKVFLGTTYDLKSVNDLMPFCLVFFCFLFSVFCFFLVFIFLTNRFCLYVELK